MYRIVATYQPSGDPVGALRKPGTVVLAYPLLFTGGGFSDAMLRSDDARTWTRIPSTDSIGRQLVHANVDGFGYFAVGQTAIPVGPASAAPSGRTLPIVLAGLAVVAGVALVVVALVRRRSRRASPQRPPRAASAATPARGHVEGLIAASTRRSGGARAGGRLTRSCEPGVRAPLVRRARGGEEDLSE